MRKRKIIAVCVLSSVLSACSVSAQSTSVTENKAAETDEWEYDGSETTIASRKEESVTVLTDASGNPKEISVDTTLSSIAGDEVIKDETDLTDIKNRNGDEQFETENGTIYWQNLGEDISYSGTCTKELPVSVEVKYYLNDDETTPEEIAGKSGRVKIRFNYINNTDYEDVHVPFVCMSALMIDTDVFSNIEVTNGEVSFMDETAIVIGYAFPSLKQDLNLGSYEDLSDIDIPEYVEIEADAKDFSLDFTETLVTNGLFKDMEEDDLNDLSETSSDMKDLAKAGDELVEGANTISSGFDSIKTTINAYLDGMMEVSGGIEALQTASKQISDGAASLESYAKTLSETLNSVSMDDESSNEAINVITTDIATIMAVSQNISSLSGSFEGLTDSLRSVLDSDTGLTDGQKEQIVSDFTETEAYQSFSASLTDMQEKLTDAIADIQSKLDGIDSSKIDEIKSQFQQLQALASGVYEGTSTIKTGVQGMSDGLSQLNGGMQEAVKNNDPIKQALSQYASGIDEFASAISELNEEALQELSQKLGNDGSRLVSSLQKLKEADASYKTFTKLSEGQEGSVMFMIETDQVSE